MIGDILIVDDERDIASLVADILEDEGYQTGIATCPDEAFASVQNRLPSLILLDIWLGDSRFGGIDILESLKKQYPYLPIIMMSGHGNIETAVSALKKGAYDFLEKPFQSERLVFMVSRALEAAQLQRENKELKLKIVDSHEFIGTSPALIQLKENIAQVAPTNSRVLIQGPSGSGKEMIARTLHQLSKRAQGPFIVINCGTLDEENLERQLFGVQTEEGAIPGFLERSHRGTLYLDEVSDLSPNLQAKLLRVLQHQAFNRVNDTHAIEVDLRILSSSTGSLLGLIKEGKFREDLYYRLNVVTLQSPPLSHRLEDIPQLASYFLTQFSLQHGFIPRVLSEEAIMALQSYEWPGNVRQLKNVMEWISIMHGNREDPLISAAMLPLEILEETPTLLLSDPFAGVIKLSLKEAREKFERDYLMAQVARFSGNISQMAQSVGMERSALHRKLKTLAIDRLKKVS
jgi:two-component system nitrogen regulation response regulator NtrX